jgi:hypothetical protein
MKRHVPAIAAVVSCLLAARVQAATLVICASEFPLSDFPLSQCDLGIVYVFDSLRLDPPAGNAPELRLSSLRAVMTEVPPGAYSLRAEGCTPWGCWVDTPVFIPEGVGDDEEVFVRVHMVARGTSPTPTPVIDSPTPSPTATPAPPACPGDVNNDGVVTIDEVLLVVNMALYGCSGDEPGTSPLP